MHASDALILELILEDRTSSSQLHLSWAASWLSPHVHVHCAAGWYKLEVATAFIAACMTHAWRTHTRPLCVFFLCVLLTSFTALDLYIWTLVEQCMHRQAVQRIFCFLSRCDVTHPEPLALQGLGLVCEDDNRGWRTRLSRDNAHFKC